MNPNFTIGRIAGIRISLNWSWLIIFALIVWSLYANVFPAQDPGLSHTTYLIMSLIAALVFFVSILLHEIGHSIVARRNGMEIEGITLWLFGGVSQFKEKFRSPGAEFRIGIAGPAVSLVLGVIFIALAVLTKLSTPVDGTLAWLGYINLLLLVFNLLPALPLDGGRVLRSALWKAKGDFVWATKIAAGIEVRYVKAGEALEGLHVRDLMTRDPVTASPDETLGHFMDSLAGRAKHSTYPVVSGGDVLGLLLFRSIAHSPRSDWDSRLVRDSMLRSDQVPVLDSEDSAEDALNELAGGEIHRGLVVQDGGLVGVISISDIGRVLHQRSAFKR